MMKKVLVCGIFYPLTMMGYFIRALQRRDDVELYTCGPHTGNYIPWNGGLSLPDKYVFTPTVPLRQETIRTGVPFEAVQDKLPDDLDLVLNIDAGWHFLTKPKGSIVCRVQSDPHVLKGFYRSTPYKFDFDFCMQSNYMDLGEKYLPYAFDPTTHFPIDGAEKVNDACLIGLHYPQRDMLVNRLRMRGLTVHYSIGEIYDEYNRIYNSSKVALSWSTLQDMPARVWEAFGMHVPLVTNRIPDLNNFFVDGEHYLGFNTIEEAEKQVMRLLSDDDLRQEISNNAYRKVKGFHTWDKRIEQIFDVVGLVKDNG